MNYIRKAPETVANFVSLVEDGFYDGLLSSHHTGFMIQGGDPEGTGMGGPGYSIKGEFADNGFEDNDLKHKRGIISMADPSIQILQGANFLSCMMMPSSGWSYAAW